ncbi:MAG: PAS domain S-box protein [Cyanobacteria bacterium P01_D01_bin.115]
MSTFARTLDCPVVSSALTEAIIPNPIVLGPETPLTAAIAQLRQVQVHSCAINLELERAAQPLIALSSNCLLVVEANQVRGIFTERDLVRLAAAGEDLQNLTVADVMTAPVVTWSVEQLTSISNTLQFMQQRHIRHLPITDQQGTLLGIVTPQSLRQVLHLMDLLQLQPLNEVMLTQIEQAAPDASVLAIAGQMAEHDISSIVITLPTAQGQREPVGIITEHDIVQLQCLGLNLANLPAHTVMSTPLCCLRPWDTLWTAYQVMQDKRIRRVVITDQEGWLVGLITQTSSLLGISQAEETAEALTVLEQRIQALEAEKLELLKGHHAALETQVIQRTAEIRAQADREQFLANFARQVSQSASFQAILTSAVEAVKQFLRCDRVVVYQFGENLAGTVIAEAIEPGWPEILGSFYQDTCFPKWLEGEYLDGAQRIVNDIYQAGLQPCHIEFLESMQVKGYLIVPLIINEQLWGILAAHHCAEVLDWHRPNLDLIDRLSIQLAIAIQQNQLYQQAQDEIRERRQADRHLQQERNFAKAIVNAAGALVVVSDPTGRIVQFNDTCQRLSGYTLQEALGQQVDDFLVPAEEIDSVRTVIKTALAGNGHGVNENHWLTKTGERRLIAWSNSVLLGVDGQVEYLVGTGIDVTESRQAENALKKSEATNRALLDTIPDLMIRMQPDGTYLDFLPARNFKVVQPFENMTGRSIYDVMPTEFAHHRMGYVERALATNQTQVYEYTFEYEGESFCEEARITVSGQDEVLVMVRDISERMQLEANRQKTEAALYNMVQGTAAATGEHFFEAFVEHLAQALDVRHTMISTCQGDQGQSIAFFSNGQLQPNVNYCLHNVPAQVALQQGFYSCLSKVTEHFPHKLLVDLGIESYFGLALRNTQNQPIGVLCVFDDKPLASPSQVESILKIFGARAAAELERQQTMDKLRQLNQELEARVITRTSELQDSNTALVESQNNLRRSKELLRLTIDNAPIGIVTMSLEGQIISVNQSFCTMLGCLPAELMGQRFEDLTYPDDRPTQLPITSSLTIEEETTPPLERRFRHRDGSAVDAIVRAGTVRTIAGEPLHLVVDVEDIRDRKQAEAERTRLLSILEASLNEILIFDAETLKFSYANHGALSNLGYTFEQMQQMTPVDLKPDFTAAKFAALIAPLREGKVDKVDFETVHQRADGSRYSVEVHLQLIQREHERVFLAVIVDITDSKQAREQINRQLLAMETAIDGIAIVRGGTYQYLNRAHVQMFGFESAQELLGQNWQTMYSAAEKKRFQQEVFPALRAQGHWQGEAISTRKDGSTFYEELSLTLSAKGDLICVRRDIDERKQAEVALRESKALLQDFFDNVSDLIQSVSLVDGHFLFVNQAWSDALGYSAAELEQLTIFDVLAADAVAAYQDLFAQLQQAGCSVHTPVEMTLLAKSGEVIQIEGNINVRCEDEIPVATRSIFRNVTERQRAERAMQNQLAAIEAAGDGIAILDQAGHYEFVNTAHCQLFGLTHTEMLDSTWHRLYLDEEITRFEQEIWPQLMRDKQWRGETIGCRKDGSTFAQEVSLTLIEGGGMVCVCQDISDRKQAEIEVHNALQTERELNDLKSRFVSMTSHEFRTPLGIIASSAGIVQDYGDRLDDDKKHKHLVRIQDSVVHMTQLLEDVLTLSRAEAGKMQLKLVPTFILDFCEEIIEELSFDDDGARINLHVETALPDVFLADQRILRQILTNLLSNALKYSPAPSEVYLRIAASTQNINIAVQDQGIGIPADDLKHLFHSFHRATNVGGIPGTGLGLSIVKRLVESHQGEISCDSQLDVGTTFTVRLPLRPSA